MSNAPPKCGSASGSPCSNCCLATSVMFSGGVAAGSEDVMAALTGILSAEGSTVETSMLHQ